MKTQAKPVKPRKPRAKRQAKPKPKKTPTPAIRATYRKVRALAESGIAGEAENAKRALEKLRGRYDFVTADDSCADIFSGCSFPRDDVAREVITIGVADSELSTFILSALANGLKIETCFRQSPADWQTRILAHVPIGSLAKIASIAEHVTASFRGAWARFIAVPGTAKQDRGVFFQGLYDGMMDETRARALTVRVRPKTKRRAERAAPAVHPYTLAVELGQKIRFAASIDDITTFIETETTKQIAA